MTSTESHQQGVKIRFHFESLSAVSVLNVMCSSLTLLYYINKRRQPFCIVFKICLYYGFCSLHHYNTTRDASTKDCVILTDFIFPEMMVQSIHM